MVQRLHGDAEPKRTHGGAFALLKLRHSSIRKSEDITSGLQHVGPVVGMCPLKQKKRSVLQAERRQERGDSGVSSRLSLLSSAKDGLRFIF